MKLSCLTTYMRWEHMEPGCVTGMITDAAFAEYNDGDDTYCAIFQ